MTYRHYIGTFNDHSDFEPAFQLDSAELLGGSIVDSIEELVKQAGFVRLPRRGLGLGVEIDQVHQFRSAEVVLPLDAFGEDSNVDVAALLEQIEPHEVLVVTRRHSHNSGGAYDYRLLAVPKGSKLQRDSRQYHRDTFDKEVNHMSGVDSNSRTVVNLPAGARVWESGQWKPAPNLTYEY